MTLGELSGAVFIQGKVRVSLWIDDEEVAVETYETDDFTGELWEDYTVHYMFASPVDGFLHIELICEDGDELEMLRRWYK